MVDKIMVDGEMYSIFEHHSRKSLATARAEIARRTKMFKSVRVVEVGKTSPYYKKGKYVVAVRGVAHVPTESASEMRKRLGAPEHVEFDKRTGKILNW